MVHSFCVLIFVFTSSFLVLFLLSMCFTRFWATGVRITIKLKIVTRFLQLFYFIQHNAVNLRQESLFFIRWIIKYLQQSSILQGRDNSCHSSCGKNVWLIKARLTTVVWLGQRAQETTTLTSLTSWIATGSLMSRFMDRFCLTKRMWMPLF